MMENSVSLSPDAKAATARTGAAFPSAAIRVDARKYVRFGCEPKE
jgi:hypothetical protein